MSEELYRVNDLYEAVNYNDRLLEENKRLNNIIKEVREYIEKNNDNSNFLEVPSKELLEILDKGDEIVSTL